jgi:hypothetical protein
MIKLATYKEFKCDGCGNIIQKRIDDLKELNLNTESQSLEKVACSHNYKEV